MGSSRQREEDSPPQLDHSQDRQDKANEDKP
jgi:hypothetical protein